MGLGEKNEEKGEKGKNKDKREIFSPCGSKIDFFGREGGGNNMIHLHNIGRPVLSLNKVGNESLVCRTIQYLASTGHKSESFINRQTFTR